MESTAKAKPAIPFCLSLVEVTLFVLSWACLGFIHGLHWLLLLCRLPDKQQRRLAAAHLASYWTGLLLTALGGTWCRNTGSMDCADGETMSRRCLWDMQHADYQFVYTAHYVGLAWVAAHWVLDGFQLLPWSLQIVRQEPLVCCCTGAELRGPQYSAVIAAAVFIVTVTWTLLVDWSTADGLGALAGILLLEIAVVGLFASVGSRLLRRGSCLRKHDVSS
eukprot:gnl/TRDRNA2_/TRDRNA2_94576_c0_seq1.p1 gnl/TRDRNA2_/TRDRNA2_94576_c0~~gnl/TRDRNA2_/TRDRNA2_94576_c0_seq1.p1  ORF type:complete len:220 (+),score=24.00 gnl/TRDRNA2_/TRDRNA2_94576_c0_seq1:22-681(+)